MSVPQRAAWRPSAHVLGTGTLLVALALLACGLLHWHGGWPAWTDPGARRLGAAVAAIAAYAGGCALLWRMRWRRTQANTLALPINPAADGGEPFLVAYASQTGFAEQLARQTAESLRAGGVPVAVEALGRLDAPRLARTARALFVVSTTGEGDAPDAAVAFVRDALERSPDLAGLRYGVLALGDRSYREFCAFGRRLDAWLRRCGAQSLFDRVDVDAGDDGALRHWQHHLGLLAGSTELPDWRAPEYARWRLVERRLLNPGSVGGACFHLALQPCEGALPLWEAGDIAEIGPRNAPARVEQALREAGLAGTTPVDGGETWAARLARSHLPIAAPDADLSSSALVTRLRPLPHREYSIASLPADGALHLLVRQFRRSDGGLGLGSGWLTAHARIGEEIALRIRTNANFHAPADSRPLILIGNGTGIAGLRALLKQRIVAGQRRNWLLFGERQAAHDFHYRAEIEAWCAQGWIERLDLAFSRDQAGRVYVQQRLREARDHLRAWIDEGAAIHVCGSLDGMAPGVERVLVEALGEADVEALTRSGRYRRDVY